MPFGGAGALAAIGAAQALPKVIASISQGAKARRVRLQDTTPAAFTEKLQMDRQAAGTARLPGLGAQQTRLGAVQAGALQGARLGAASGSDFLAAAGAADARRQQGEMQLGTMGLQYMDKSRQQLGASLQQQAAYQQHDLDNFNREKAALTQAEAENANAAIGTAASYAAAGINRQDNLAEAAANRAAGSPSYGSFLNSGLGANLTPSLTPPTARRAPGLSASDSAAYDLDALPDTAPVPGLTNPYKTRRPGLGAFSRSSRIGL